MSSCAVLVDATAIPPNLGGVGRYLENLIPALAKQADIAVTVVCQARDARWIRESNADLQVVPIPARWQGRLARLIWEQFRLPALARSLGVDVIHSPHYTMPIASRMPVAVTLHDATFFSHPAVHSALKRVFFRTWIRFSVRRASRVIVPSDSTRTELARYITFKEHQTVVAHHGVDSAKFRIPTAAELERAVAELNLPPEGWICFLGTVEPRKNVANLVRAHARLSAARSTPPLLIVGAPGWDTETAPLVASLPAGQVRMLGYVDASHLAAVLGGSTVFVYPSLAEGFGLPVLEAMACGAPTLTTRPPALAEVGGDAVEYCGFSDTEIEASLGALLDDTERRRALASEGPERARLFNWGASAAAHRDAYLAAASS